MFLMTQPRYTVYLQHYQVNVYLVYTYELPNLSTHSPLSLGLWGTIYTQKVGQTSVHVAMVTYYNMFNVERQA